MHRLFPSLIFWQLYFCFKPVCLRLGAELWASSSFRKRKAEIGMPEADMQLHSSLASLKSLLTCDLLSEVFMINDQTPGTEPPSSIPVARQYLQRWGKGVVFRNTLASLLAWNPPILSEVSQFRICRNRSLSFFCVCGTPEGRIGTRGEAPQGGSGDSFQLGMWKHLKMNTLQQWP